MAVPGTLPGEPDRLAARISPRAALALATFIAAAGYLVISLPLGFAGLCIGLIVGGIGSSVQHPRASLLVTNTFGAAPRQELGIYNFAGDLGKATFPAAVALLIPIVAWRPVVGLTSLVQR
jgi:FSR family fosmidomycin resistance protein-like MFS transporter